MVVGRLLTDMELFAGESSEEEASCTSSKQFPNPETGAGCHPAASSTQPVVSETPRVVVPARPPPAWGCGDKKLRNACDHHDIRRVQDALANGAGMSGDGSGKTALHCAARAGFVEGVQLLLKSGFDPNLECKVGLRPVDEAEYWAAKYREAKYQQWGVPRSETCMKCRNLIASWGGVRFKPTGTDDHVAFLKLQETVGNKVEFRPWKERLPPASRRPTLTLEEC
mmetsp:Transcript_33397/g.75002  ORF Transcript_33397/g.75002 Transcript_33397/m.75002 type:complete len:225 (+) Transcript_33397:69-743(+)